MITRVQVRNFGSIAEADVSLGPLTVLVGRNGAGKSTFIDVLRFVRDALTQGLENAIFERNGFDSLRHRWATEGDPTSITLTVEKADLKANYGFSLEPKGEGGYRVVSEFGQAHYYEEGVWTDNEFNVDRGKLVSLSFARSDNPFIDPTVNDSVLRLSALPLIGLSFYLLSTAFRGNYHRLSPEILRVPQPPSNETLLWDDGVNLASVIRHIQQKQPSSFRQILSVVGRVVPDITGITVAQLGGYLVTQMNHKVPMRRGSDGKYDEAQFTLQRESDGTLRLLATLAALHQGGEDHEIFGGPLGLEEPEDSIHPGALAILADEIRETAGRRQVLIATQSPDLISRFRAEELQIVERVDGATQIGPLAEHQRKAIEEHLFSAGDLLRIEGLKREPVLVPETAEAR